MGEPKLYEEYDRNAAIALFGPEAEARSLCDGQWVVFPEAVLCFAEVGDPPRMSHFRNGGESCWVADAPYQVNDIHYARFVLREVVGGRTPCHTRLPENSRVANPGGDAPRTAPARGDRAGRMRPPGACPVSPSSGEIPRGPARIDPR